MKYLKRYEDIDDEIKICLKIIDWMKSNNLERVYFDDLLCETGLDKNWVIKEMYFCDEGIKVYCYSPLRNDLGDFSFYEEQSDMVSWNLTTLNRILNILNNMTQEEIEDQRIKGESAKFNI